MSASCASRSTTFPFASSPHWAPTTTIVATAAPPRNRKMDSSCRYPSRASIAICPLVVNEATGLDVASVGRPPDTLRDQILECHPGSAGWRPDPHHLRVTVLLHAD